MDGHIGPNEHGTARWRALTQRSLRLVAKVPPSALAPDTMMHFSCKSIGLVFAFGRQMHLQRIFESESRSLRIQWSRNPVRPP